MSSILTAMAVLACPVGMGIMMWIMSRGWRHGSGQEQPAIPAQDPRQEQITQLRAEIDQLKADRAVRRGQGER